MMHLPRVLGTAVNERGMAISYADRASPAGGSGEAHGETRTQPRVPDCLELAGDGIRVNCLSPGRVLTPRILQLDEARAEREGQSVDQVRPASVAGLPLRPLGDVPACGRGHWTTTTPP